MMDYSSPLVLYKRKVCSRQVGRYAYLCYNCLVNIIGQGSNNNYTIQVNDATVALINESFRVKEY